MGQPKPAVTDKNFRLELEDRIPARSQILPDYTTVVDCERRYIEVSDSFCELVGYKREELLSKTYDELTAPGTNDIPTVFHMFIKNGYMYGLWMLAHRTGKQILIRYESWVRPDCLIQSNMELVKGLVNY